MLNTVLIKAYDKACPLRTIKNRKSPPWWTKDLLEIRRRTRALFNLAKATNSQADWDTYKVSQRKFKKAIISAKRITWRTFCSDIESTTESARLRKILCKESSVPGYLKDTNGTWTQSCEETLSLLLQTHFPGCTTNQTNQSSFNTTIAAIPVELVTEDKLNWAIDTFSPFKSPGCDGIFPIMLQKAKTIIIPILKRLFTRSLECGYIPKAWREVRVVFIPKAGKSSHTTAKDFRPISLTSFTLKTFEKLMNVFVRSRLDDSAISSAQHAYIKGKGVETALHEVVSTIEKSLEDKEYTLAAFLDIEGAFNNVKTCAVKRALQNSNVDQSLTNVIINLLSERNINAKIGDTALRVTAARGTPQGGVISPLLWVLVINEILIRFKNMGVTVTAYADDVVLLAKGKFLQTISDLLGNSLRTLSTWTKQCGLGVNPQKTELVLFTNKRIIPQFQPPTLEGIPLKVTDRAKYLGIILDRKLNWKPNVNERVKKAANAFYACNRIFGRRWGPNPKIILWMYTAIVRPILTYGSVVWWQAAGKATNLKAMTKIQRLACIGTTSAMRTTPTAGLEAILNLTPLDLYMEESATKSALRISQTNTWNPCNFGHAQILEKNVGNDVTSDYMSPHLNFDIPFSYSFPSRDEWRTDEPTKRKSVSIYTDGSKMDCGTGAGIFCEELNIHCSIRLPDNSSVFQAEILAIAEAARMVSLLAIPRNDITIFIDSQAAIKAISAIEIKSKLVHRCREELKVLCSQHSTNLCWVPGHSDKAGNEIADELARKGSAMDHDRALQSIKPPLCNFRERVENKIRMKTNNRWKALTTCEVSRKLWPAYDKGRTIKLLQFDRPSLSKLVGALTGHNFLRNHMMKLNLIDDDICRGCGDEEVHEDTPHFLCHCPSLCHLRNRTLGSFYFHDLRELSDVTLSDLYRFLRTSGWLDGVG